MTSLVWLPAEMIAMIADNSEPAELIALQSVCRFLRYGTRTQFKHSVFETMANLRTVRDIAGNPDFAPFVRRLDLKLSSKPGFVAGNRQSLREEAGENAPKADEQGGYAPDDMSVEALQELLMTKLQKCTTICVNFLGERYDLQCERRLCSSIYLACSIARGRFDMLSFSGTFNGRAQKPVQSQITIVIGPKQPSPRLEPDSDGTDDEEESDESGMSVWDAVRTLELPSLFVGFLKDEEDWSWSRRVFGPQSKVEELSLRLETSFLLDYDAINEIGQIHDALPMLNSFHMDRGYVGHFSEPFVLGALSSRRDNRVTSVTFSNLILEYEGWKYFLLQFCQCSPELRSVRLFNLLETPSHKVEFQNRVAEDTIPGGMFHYKIEKSENQGDYCRGLHYQGPNMSLALETITEMMHVP